MSFILDALRKSETDRQQKSSPGLADVPTGGRERSSSRWLPLLLGLLGINLVVLLVLLLRPAPAPSVAAESDGEPPETVPAAAAPAPISLARREPDAVERGPAAVATTVTAGVSSPPVGAAAAGEALAPTDQAKASQPDSPGASAAPAAAGTSAPTGTGRQEDYEETFLTLNDLRASSSVELPEMHIDLHVYSDNPAERFVFINMNQYRENATLNEGPRVRRITSDGVILEYRGSSFLLPRE